MTSLNKVMLIGNLTADPRVKEVSAGRKVAELGLAIDDSYRRKDGEKKASTVFVDVVAWGNQAKAAETYLAKGRTIFVEGKLQLDTWTSREGQSRSRLRVLADRIQFLGAPNGKRAAESDASTPEPAETVEF